VSLVIALAAAVLFLEWPWHLAVVIPAALLEAAEVALWVRWRNRPAMTGAEGIIGARGRTLTDCRPDGQANVRGRIWQVRCDAGADTGADVVVTDVSGLRLIVEPAAPR